MRMGLWRGGGFGGCFVGLALVGRERGGGKNL